MMEWKSCVLIALGLSPSPDTKHPYKRIFNFGRYYYGKHTIGHATNCSDDLLRIEKVKLFLVSLCETIDMVRYGDPIVERFGQHAETGISAVQLIETSAIVIHTNDEARELYIDVFSCKDYDLGGVRSEILKWFGSAETELNTKVLLRE